MQREPRISVVVPAYNHERFIGEAIDSILAQTLQDFEVIVVDDGSSDDTAGVVEDRAARDRRIRLLRQDNRGSHAAINRGVRECAARWVAILNSDDRYMPTRLHRLTEVAESGARFVVSDVRLVDAGGAEIADSEHWWNRALAGFREAARQYGPVEGLMYGNYTVSTSNFFFERSLFEAVGAFRPRRRVLDWDYALRAALHEPERFRFLAGEYLLEYRLHGGNAILADPLRGSAEIARTVDEVLGRLGVPRALQASIKRNRRELRRGWRDREVARVERFLREREAEIERIERFVREREADVAALRSLAQNQEAELSRLAQHVRECEALIGEAESSFAWRVIRQVRRMAGRGLR